MISKKLEMETINKPTYIPCVSNLSLQEKNCFLATSNTNDDVCLGIKLSPNIRTECEKVILGNRFMPCLNVEMCQGICFYPCTMCDKKVLGHCQLVLCVNVLRAITRDNG